MQEKSGLTALREIRTVDREDAATVPIIIVSALSEDNCAEVEDRKLISSYIQKPLSVDKLRNALLML